MTDKNSLITRLLRQMESKIVSTLFINGPPGAGKSHLLNELAAQLPGYVANLQVLGPYNTAKDNVNARIVEDLCDLRYLEPPIPMGIDADWYSAWSWLKDNLKTSRHQNLLVLIRLDGSTFSNYEELRVWFSSIRYMEHYWTSDKIRVLVVVAGYWNHLGLENYYDKIQLSFPYTVSTNYMSWNKISLEEAIQLFIDKCPAARLSDSLGHVVYEITGGLAGAIVDLLKFLPSGNLSMADIYTATRKAAQEGEYGRTLVKSWSELPPGSMEPVKNLLLFRRLDNANKGILDLLVVAGIVAYQDILGQSFFRINSWYIELLLRSNADTLGISDDGWKNIQFQEFAPSIVTLNMEAYRIISNIENMIRNFVLTNLFQQDAGNDHVLQNRALKRGQSSVDEDAYERANDWRRRNRLKGIDVNLNPLIAYTSMGDLMQLLRETAVTGDSFWNEIVHTMEKITPIRDAVMHNQVIDEKSLEGLYSLQAKVYTALNW